MCAADPDEHLIGEVGDLGVQVSLFSRLLLLLLLLPLRARSGTSRARSLGAGTLTPEPWPLTERMERREDGGLEREGPNPQHSCLRREV